MCCQQPVGAHAEADSVPPEVKPRIENALHDITIMKHAASCLDEHVYVFTSDAKDYFNQLQLAR